MCIVLDANVFSCVFNPKDIDHVEFRPVRNWIYRGPGFLVYGGTEYKQQLRKCPNYLSYFNELSKKRKTKEVNHKLVDKQQAIVNELMGPHDDCDDTHIIAILRVSGCRLFCSKDAKADRYITDKRFYTAKQRPPKIYRSGKHKNLLCSAYIVMIKNLV